MAPPAPPLPLVNSSQPGLTRQEKADAIRSIHNLLDELGTNWEYRPPPPPRPPRSPVTSKAPPPSRSLSLRSGGLGSWRPSEPAGTDAIAVAPTVEEEVEGDEYSSASDASSSSSSTLSFSSESRTNGASYRRPSTPTTTSQRKRKRRRRRSKPREGVWRARIDDSDFEIPSEGDKDDEALKSPYRFHSPDAVPSPEHQRHRREWWLKEQMAENPGLALWTARREAWTGGDGKGNVPVGRSRFADNPLTELVTPDVYNDLYSRCVVQGAELPVPINLKAMTEALVQGWKSDDQWPPKPTPAEPGMRVPMGRMGVMGSGGGGTGNALSGGPGSREEALAVVGKMGGRVRRYLGIK